MGSVLILIKICMFCGKCCVCSDKCVSIVVKIKCVNFGNISDIYNKLSITTNYTYFTTTDTYFYQHTQKLQFLTPLMGRSRCDLSIFGNCCRVFSLVGTC